MLEDLEASNDRQFRQEMDDYDRVIAKAHEIAKKDRQRQELESDSEHSELASSACNKMEGIEIGSGTVIGTTIAVEDQEMGGTLTDGQIGQGMGRTETSGNSEAQVPVFSPRKTRSGRVRKWE